MADLNDSDRDIKRLRQEYARRSSDGFLATRYSTDNPAQRYMIERRHQAIKTLLGQRLKTRLSDLSILEIGCRYRW